REKDAPAAPLDRTIQPHLTTLIVRRVIQTRGLGAERTSRRPVQISGTRAAQRLVRPLLVVFPTKRVEAQLLTRHQCLHGTRRLLLQRPVHTLMPPIVLRLGRPPSLHANTQLEPPHRKPRESTQRVRTERRTLSERIRSGSPYSSN